MLFSYKAVDQSGAESSGSIDAVSMDVAIASLQRRGLVISEISPAGKEPILSRRIEWFSRVSPREVVILSRQLATLFESQVSALRIFRLLASEAENPKLREILTAVADDIQGGLPISKALEKHPEAFSPFYASMVHAGEEAGKLDETFLYLADYLDRTYEITSKARNALIYPAFVVATFVVVMILMLTLVIPRISAILIESGQEIPLYTKVVIGISSFFVDFGAFLVIFLVLGGVALWRYTKTERGRIALDTLRLSVPYVGDLYRRMYLARLADNLSTMLASGITMIRALEITASVVGSPVYGRILTEATELVKGGAAVSEIFGRYPEFPGIMVQMVKVGEESGEVGTILKTLARFYQREVANAVDTLVNLIEPVMIVALGLGVGLLLASVLIPIYNISSAI